MLTWEGIGAEWSKKQAAIDYKTLKLRLAISVKSIPERDKEAVTFAGLKQRIDASCNELRPTKKRGKKPSSGSAPSEREKLARLYQRDMERIIRNPMQGRFKL